jgi:hypothetical protein
MRSRGPSASGAATVSGSGTNGDNTFNTNNRRFGSTLTERSIHDENDLQSLESIFHTLMFGVSAPVTDGQNQTPDNNNAAIGIEGFADADRFEQYMIMQV